MDSEATFFQMTGITKSYWMGDEWSPVLRGIDLTIQEGEFLSVLGLMVSMLLASLMDIAFVLSPGAIALGVGFSLAVGVVFGWAPARKASNLNPIDALRSL